MAAKTNKLAMSAAAGASAGVALAICWDLLSGTGGTWRFVLSLFFASMLIAYVLSLFLFILLQVVRGPRKEEHRASAAIVVLIVAVSVPIGASQFHGDIAAWPHAVLSFIISSVITGIVTYSMKEAFTGRFGRQ